jgi:hypothetical protein
MDERVFVLQQLQLSPHPQLVNEISKLSKMSTMASRVPFSALAIARYGGVDEDKLRGLLIT